MAGISGGWRDVAEMTAMKYSVVSKISEENRRREARTSRKKRKRKLAKKLMAANVQ